MEMRNAGATTLNFRHDVVGDIMTIEKCRPYPEQVSDEIDAAVVGRMNPDTGEVESLEILSFAAHITGRNPLRLAIPVAPGSICGWPAAAEFDCLAQPGSPWLTIPADAEITGLYIPGWLDAETPAPGSAPA